MGSKEAAITVICPTLEPLSPKGLGKVSGKSYSKITQKVCRVESKTHLDAGGCPEE
jgi:hypothetical protein